MIRCAAMLPVMMILLACGGSIAPAQSVADPRALGHAPAKTRDTTITDAEKRPNPMCAVGPLDGEDADDPATALLAPTGVLRVGINYGNVNNARFDAQTHVLSGVAIDLACRLASRLGVPLVFTGPGPGYPGIPQQMADFYAGNFDVGFSADVLQAPIGTITAHPHIAVENHFLVPANSRFTIGTLAELDQQGVKISVGNSNAPDLFFKAFLKNATRVDTTTNGAPLTVPQAIKLLTTGQVDAFAGGVSVELPFTPTFRILPTPFLVVNLAMFVSARNLVGQRFLSVFVEWAKKRCYIQQAIDASHLVGVAVPAPIDLGGIGDVDDGTDSEDGHGGGKTGHHHDVEDQSDDGDDPDYDAALQRQRASTSQAILSSPAGVYTQLVFPGTDVTQTIPTRINRKGVIVGAYTAAGVEHGFILQHGDYSSFTPPTVTNASQGSRIWGINDHGDMVGRWVDLQGATHGWSVIDGVYRNVDFPGNLNFSSAVAINNDRTIVGAYDTSSLPAIINGRDHGVPNNHLQHAFILTENGSYISFDGPATVGKPATFTAALAINDDGFVAGRYDTDGSNSRLGFIRDERGSISSIGEPDGTLQSIIFGLNNEMEFVGWYQASVTQVQHGYVFSGGRFTTVDIAGATNTLVHDIASMKHADEGERGFSLDGNHSNPIVGEYRNKLDGKIYGFLLTDWDQKSGGATGSQCGNQDNGNDPDGDEH